MNRTAWLQDRRMQKFRDVLSRWERGELSMHGGRRACWGCRSGSSGATGERYEEDGVEGLLRPAARQGRRRSGCRSDEIAWMLESYRTHYRGWNVKHFHEHLQRDHGFRWGYTWTKTQLHTAGLVERARRRGPHRRKRERKPCEGMMLHQDAARFAWLEGTPDLDLIVTMDDATSRSTRHFWSRRKARLRRCGRCLRCSPRRACHRASTPIAAATTSSPRRRARRSTRSGSPRSAGRWQRLGNRAYPGLFAGGARAQRADVRHPAGPAAQGAG